MCTCLCALIQTLPLPDPIPGICLVHTLPPTAHVCVNVPPSLAGSFPQARRHPHQTPPSPHCSPSLTFISAAFPQLPSTYHLFSPLPPPFFSCSLWPLSSLFSFLSSLSPSLSPYLGVCFSFSVAVTHTHVRAHTHTHTHTCIHTAVREASSMKPESQTQK